MNIYYGPLCYLYIVAPASILNVISQAMKGSKLCIVTTQSSSDVMTSFPEVKSNTRFGWLTQPCHVGQTLMTGTMEFSCNRALLLKYHYISYIPVKYYG